MLIVLPWHLTDRLVDGLNLTLPADMIELESRPGTTGEPWSDLGVLYAPLAEEVASADGVPVVLTGDCVACLAVIAGIQRRGIMPSLVWFDAHGDFHTEATTASGYLGGLPLAKAVGRGDLTLPAALGMAPLPEESVVLVDGRDLDPPETEALTASGVRRLAADELDAAVLPPAPLIIHVDLDVIDSAQLSGLRFPAPGGPSVDEVAAAVAAVARAREVVALDIAATWRPEDADRTQSDTALQAVLDAAGVS